MSSRFGFDASGEPIVIVTTPSLGLEVGQVFRLLGNSFDADGDVCWLGRSGRPPTAREQIEARAPYSAAAARRQRERREPDDDEVTDREAIEWARLAQQHAPPDLIAAA